MSAARRSRSGDVSLQDAADILGVHYMTAYRYVRTGRLPAQLVDDRWRVRRADLDRLEPPRAPGRVRAGSVPDRARDVGRLSDRLVLGDETEAWRIAQQLLASSCTPEHLYLDVLGPALRRIGDHWAAGTITVAEEHRASAVMYRLVGRLGPLFVHRGRTRGQVVIGAPAGDYHGLATALVADVLRGRRIAVADLGANTPAASFAEAAALAVRLVATGIVVSSPVADPVLAETVAAVKSATDAPVLLGGLRIRSDAQARRLGADARTNTARAAVDWFDAMARR